MEGRPTIHNIVELYPLSTKVCQKDPAKKRLQQAGKALAWPLHRTSLRMLMK